MSGLRSLASQSIAGDGLSKQSEFYAVCCRHSPRQVCDCDLKTFNMYVDNLRLSISIVSLTPTFVVHTRQWAFSCKMPADCIEKVLSILVCLLHQNAGHKKRAKTYKGICMVVGKDLSPARPTNGHGTADLPFSS